MIPLEYLYAFTRSEVTVKDKRRVTLAFGQEASAEEIILGLLDHFGRHEKQQAVRLVVGGSERGYLLRTDLYSLMPLGGTRGVGEGDFASLPGTPPVTLTELCCPTRGCTQVVVVTEFDESDPTLCEEHGTAMERCE